MKIGVKPYPSCRYTHAALDALIAMRREHNLTPDQIKRVEIGLHRNGITLTGDAATKRHPTSIVGGQFSMFFTGAVALDQGRFGWDDYDAARRCRGRCARRQVRRGAGRPARDRPHPSVRRARLDHHRRRRARAALCRSLRRAEFVPGRAGDAAEISHAARPVLNGRADQLADAILSLERFDRVEKATQLGGSKAYASRSRAMGEVIGKSGTWDSFFFFRRIMLERDGPVDLLPAGELCLVAGGGHDVADELEHAIGLRRPVRRTARAER